MATIAKKSQNANRSNSFGTVPMTANRQAIMMAENYFLTQDATLTPVVSPVAVTTGADTALTVPAAATQLRIVSSTALRISDAAAATQYFVIPANTPMDIPCTTPTNEPNTNSGIYYLRADATNATVQFMFLCV